jgi:hypothetical protein
MQTEFTTGGLIAYQLSSALMFAIIGCLAGYQSVANSLHRRLPRGWLALNFLVIWIAIAIGQQIASALLPDDEAGHVLATASHWIGCLLIGAASSALFLTSRLTSRGQPLASGSAPASNTDA